MNTVRIRKSQLDYFRRLARDCPYEMQAYLIGEVRSPKLTIVSSIEYCTEYDTQTKANVAWTGLEWSRVKRLAEERGERIVGDIHTHLDWDAVMSPSDYEGAVTDGLHICGIVSVEKRRTRVRFWNVHSSLPIEVEHVPRKNSPKEPRITE